jgi:hypothetical protein
MAANEFEKNVKKAMDEFKLHPSEAVWQKVEERIQEKKKRRRILFFFIFSLVGLALAGYGIYNFSSKQITHQDTNKSENFSVTKNNSIKSTPVPHHESIAIIKHDCVEKNTRHQGPGEFVTQKKKTSKENNNVLFARGRNFTAVDAPEKRNKEAEKIIIEKTNQIKTVENISLTKLPQFLKDGSNQKNVAGYTEKATMLNIIADTISINNPDNKTGQETGVAKKEKNKAAQKLKWGINVSMGSSTITEDRFSLKSSYVQADRIYSSANPFPGGSLNRYPPSTNKSAFAFKAGMGLKKDISRRSHVSIGLQYAYVGDRIKTAIIQNNIVWANTGANTGANNFTGQSSYYSAIPQKTYTDRFHFIELPIFYDWRVTNNTNHFLSLGAGISPAWLIATNGLVYDTAAGGIYFHNKSSFTRTHINLMAGLSYHFDKGFEWSIGPQFYFDASKLIKNDFDKRKYFLYSGIDARIFIGK